MIFRNKVEKQKKKISRFFETKISRFLKNKKPKSESYPFIQHDPYHIFGENSAFESYYLIGDNWVNGQDKPIAVMWGFNDWKLGFISDYLPEYRTLFVPRRMVGFFDLPKLRQKIGGNGVFIVWGFNERGFVRRYAKSRKVPLWRMEDAFIRSSALGASHATPYSLILDKTGFYYDCSKPSDIENILNRTDFKADPELLNSAQKALDTIIELKLSKYNPPTVSSTRITDKIKIRKRIMVLGQVDSDASIRLGNPDNWNAEELVKLAKFENPNAEVIYRPHPEIYKGYQKSRFKKKRIERIATVVSPEEPFIESLASIDHVYTITSLSGFEALLRGKEVTVVGAPFYAGWGLTDDRVKIERRKAKLELVELFAGSYLLYPKYLANLNNSYIGLKSAVNKINFDKFEGAFKEAFSGNEEYRDFYPALITNNRDKDLKKIFNGINFSQVFNRNDQDDLYQLYISLFLLGYATNNDERNIILIKARNYLSFEVINEVLVCLDKIYPGEYVQLNLSWLLDKNNEYSESVEILIDSQFEELDLSEEELFAKSDNKFKFSLLENSFQKRDFTISTSVIKQLLLNNYKASTVFNYAISLCELTFKFDSSIKLSQFSQRIDLYGNNRLAVTTELKASKYSSINDFNYYINLFSKAVTLKPDNIILIHYLIALLAIDDESKREITEYITSIVYLDNEVSPRKIMAYLALEDFNKAYITVTSLFSEFDKNHTSADYVLYSQVLSYVGKEKEALDLMKLDIARKVTSANLRESLRLCVLCSDYKESLNLLEIAKQEQLELGDMHKRKAYFGNRMVYDAFHTFTEIGLINTVKKYFPDESLSLKELENAANIENEIFLISIFGPGDEIRFASIYNSLLSVFVNAKLKISCTPRLYDLFSRSFPQIKFIKIPRPRANDAIELSEYSQVPGSDIISVINNTAVTEIQKTKQYYFITDLLHHCLPDYESFKGYQYLLAEQNKVQGYQQRLDYISDKLVGLTWRSSLNTHSRNEHYLTIEELEPLFSIPGITFVNFQYDQCDEELAWVEERYPSKLIDFEDIDHFNDFDSVSALMNCMDLMIAPCTTVVELAGALGCPTWLFSNSSEIDWRKIDDKGTDVWHNSITIVEGDTVGDKISLVNELHQRLIHFSEDLIENGE